MKFICKILLLAFFSIVLHFHLSAQKSLISEDSAISIALRNGLKIGLAEYKNELKDDSLWIINSLICDDEPERIYDTKAVNALTGKASKDIYMGMIEMRMEYGGRIERTKINTNLNIDTLPISHGGLERKLTNFNERESTPIFSDDNRIAFQYGFGKIGIINIDGSGFKQICDECLYPQWLNNDWIMYFRDFEHIYKKNIHANTEIRITNMPYRYDDFQLSPNKKWIVYQSFEMWPTKDSSGNIVLYSSTNGAGINLAIMSIDGQELKFFKKDWAYYYYPSWSNDSDSLFFYISDQKYYASDLNNREIDYFKYDLLQNISLNDSKKVINGTFPLIYRCQILEIDRRTLKPIKILVNELGRYRDVYFSKDKQYLIYSKSDKKDGDYSLYIKRIKN